MNQFKIKRKNLILPMINNKEIINNQEIINNETKIGKDYLVKNNNLKKKINPINNIKLPQIYKNISNIKNKYDCLDAEEYISQFQTISEKYDYRELNIKLEKLKKILINQGFYLVKTPWDSVWDNNLYAIDYTYEYIYKRYTERLFNEYDKLYKINYNNKKHSKKITCMLFVDKLVSYLSISNYSLCMSKLDGRLKINCNFINDDHEKIIIGCLNELFLFRIDYNKKDKMVTINLKKIF